MATAISSIISHPKLKFLFIAIFIALACAGCTKIVDTERSCLKCDGDGVRERWFTADETCTTCNGSGKVPAKNEQISWPRTLLATALFLGILATPYVVYKKIEKNLSDKRSKAAAEEMRKRDAEKVAFAEEQFGRFLNWLTPILIIDSNIWMDEKYDSFFDCLRMACTTKNYKIELFGVQFDEIANIKKACSYGEARNQRARLAINRIEDFQKASLLRVVPVTIDAKRGAYADPIIVKVLASKSREGKECTLFTNDKELRVRARQVLTDYSEADYRIVEIDKKLGTLEKIVEGYRIRGN